MGNPWLNPLLGSWTTAHRRPWCFCCLLVFLYWFLQHFACLSPCLWAVFQSLFLSFQCFFCYVVNFLLRVLHALDATLWTFFLEVLHALDATFWTFFLEVLHALDATLWTFVWGGFWGGLITFCRLRSCWRRSVDATLWTFVWGGVLGGGWGGFGGGW